MFLKRDIKEARAGLIPASDYEPLFHVYCKPDRSWMKDAAAGTFTQDKRDAVTVDEQLGKMFISPGGAYELVPVEPSLALRNPELQAAIDEAREAYNGDSNDAEHDALYSLLRALGEEVITND